MRIWRAIGRGLLLGALVGGLVPSALGQLPGRLPKGVLIETLKNKRLSMEERMRALEQLALGDEALPFSELAKVRTAVRGEFLIDYARCLGRCGTSAIPSLEKLLRKRDPLVRAEAAFALVQLDRENGEALARELLRAKRQDEPVLVAALRGLSERGSAFARIEALRRMERAEGAFLLECIATLRKHPELDDAPYLIDLLEVTEGRPANETVHLLWDLTGYRVGNDAKTWKYFMLKHKTEGTPFRHDGPEQTEPPTVSYMGIPVVGEKVVFVLDSSSSMQAVMPSGQRRESRGKRAVNELIALLPRLPGHARFNVVFFGTEVTAFDEGLVQRDDESVGEIARWLRNHEFEGGTNLYGGLELAFADEEVEEIILLSDGDPTQGDYVHPSEILARVARWNRWRNVRVSTISLMATPSARGFLQRLAGDHGGVSRVVE